MSKSHDADRDPQASNSGSSSASSGRVSADKPRDHAVPLRWIGDRDGYDLQYKVGDLWITVPRISYIDELAEAKAAEHDEATG